jgi:exoribonuclease II
MTRQENHDLGTPHPFDVEDDAATPLTDEEKDGLIPSWVTFRHELNEVEQANIAKGALWASRQRRRDLLSMNPSCVICTSGCWAMSGPGPESIV